MNASAMCPGLIIFNAAWAARIALYDSPETFHAFKSTVGHELTHKDKEINRMMYSGAERKFIAQLNEVHADFGGADKMFASSRDALLRAIEYRKSIIPPGQDNGDFAHPPWWKRYEYAKGALFGKDLICQIACDNHCENEELIQKSHQFL